MRKRLSSGLIATETTTNDLNEFFNRFDTTDYSVKMKQLKEQLIHSSELDQKMNRG